MFAAYFLFKPTHFERHYLVNPRGRAYHTTFSRNRKEAKQFRTEEEALAAIRKILDRGDRGRSDGYLFTEFVEAVTPVEE